MLSNLGKIATLIVIGSMLLIAGLFLIWYPFYMIGRLQNSLSLSELSQEDRSALEGSFNWWRIWGKTTCETLSFFLLSVGTLFLVLAVVYYFVTRGALEEKGKERRLLDT